MKSTEKAKSTEKTKRKKKGITPKDLLIITIVIVILVVVAFFIFKKKDTTPKVRPSETEEFVSILEDGTKQNTSNKLAETKEIEGLEISNIRLTEKDGLTLLLADVRNPGNKDNGDFGVDIKLVDKEGNELATIGGYIDSVKVGETVTLNITVTSSLANSYDFEVKKAE